VDDVAPVCGFLHDAHADGVAACVAKLAQYPLSEAQVAAIRTAYTRDQGVRVDLWTRMLDSLHLARVIDSGTFQRLNAKRIVSASYDERCIHPTPFDDDDPCRDSRVLSQLYRLHESHSHVDERRAHDVDQLVQRFDWLYGQVERLSGEVEGLTALVQHLRSTRPARPLDVQFRVVDEHDQMQFFGSSTFAIKDHLKPLGATWLAPSRMWVVSTDKGRAFMRERAAEFTFIQVAN